MSGFRASLLKPTSRILSGEPAATHRFSHGGMGPPSPVISWRIRVRVGGSCSLRKRASYPPARAQGDTQASKPVAPAVYVYMSAVTLRPSRRAASTFSMAASIFGQLAWPAALRW